MIYEQILLALLFYLVFTACAGIGLPLTHKIFPKSFNLAYFSAKPLGLAMFGCVVWLLASFKVIDYQNTTLILNAFVVLVAAGFIYALREVYKKIPVGERFKQVRNFIILELISIALYLGYLYIRSYNAGAYGTERFMDMMLVNSSLKTSSFPFIDSWYSLKLVNYYYYGHYLVSVLTKLSGISSFFTYTFTLGILYSSSFLMAGLLVYEISKSKLFAALSGIFLTTSGSLFYSGCVFYTWIKGQSICNYASSTRLYTPSYIINEVPSYSFTVGDLHAHFLALPFFILNLILIFALATGEKINKYLAVALLFSLSASALVNPSDVTSLAVLLTGLWLYRAYGFYKSAGSFKKLWYVKEFQPWVYLAVFLIIGLLLLTAPFVINFKSPVLGFGLTFFYAYSHNLFLNGSQYPTPMLALLGMWGFYVIASVICLDGLHKEWKQNQFLVLGFLSAIFLIVFVEVFFVKDIYHIANPAYFRANTVFKYGYHTWIILSIVTPALLALYLKQEHLKKARTSIIYLVLFFVGLSLVYPYEAVDQFYLSYPKYRTLDAAVFFSDESSDDLMAISWMNQNLKNRPVVLEAVGDSYSYFGRISAFTGNPTVMGWKTHEWTWRFEGAAAAKAKEKNPNANVETGYGPISIIGDDVGQIYQSPSLELTQILLQRYKINYVYIGQQERNTYRALDESKFSKLGTKVFTSGVAALYKIN